MKGEPVVTYCGNCANCSAPVMTQREAWWPVSFPMPCPGLWAPTRDDTGCHGEERVMAPGSWRFLVGMGFAIVLGDLLTALGYALHI